MNRPVAAIFSILVGAAVAQAAGYEEVTFAKLGVLDGINRLLNGKQVAVKGYMMPVEIEKDGDVRNFLLMRTRASCCFGAPLELTDFIEVRMKNGRKGKFLMDRTITVRGDLEVGARVENGEVTSLYRMAADEVELSEESKNTLDDVRRLQQELEKRSAGKN